MPEQQVANTEPQQPQEGTEPQQVQDTVQEPQGQPQVAEPTEDLSKIDPTQLTPEQVTELQKGYMRDKDYTQKTQVLSDEQKKLTDYDALIQKPDFIQWAANKQAQVQSQTQPSEVQQQEEEKLENMSENERVQYFVKKQMAPIAQQYYQDKRTMEDKELTTKYQTNSQYVPKINQMKNEIAKQPYLYREEAFKVLDYEPAQKRSFEAGRQEGLKGIQQRTQANMVQEGTGSTVQREQIKGPGAIEKIWNRAEGEGRTA